MDHEVPVLLTAVQVDVVLQWKVQYALELWALFYSLVKRIIDHQMIFRISFAPATTATTAAAVGATASQTPQ